MEQGAKGLSEHVLERAQALAGQVGDHNPGEIKLSEQQQAQRILPEWLALYQSHLPRAEAWRESLIAAKGPKAFVRLGKHAQRLYQKPNASLEATLAMTSEQRDLYYLAKAVGAHDNLEERGGHA